MVLEIFTLIINLQIIFLFNQRISWSIKCQKIETNLRYYKKYYKIISVLFNKTANINICEADTFALKSTFIDY